MNIKLVSVAAALAVSAAVAQDYDDEYEEEAPAAAESVQEEAPAAPAPEPAPAPAPAPVMNDGFESLTAQTAEAAPAAGNGSLNVLHGNAYNLVGNEFASSTIGNSNGGDMGAIYKMSGRNLVYVEPTGEYGALSLAKGSMTYILAFDNGIGQDQGLVTAGLAMGSFGVAVDFVLDKTWASTENKNPANNTKTTSSTSTTRMGDLLQARIGAKLGAMDITAAVYWLTFNDEVDTENDDGLTPKRETDNDFWDLGANLNLSNGPSASSFAWSVGVQFLRQKSWHKTTTGPDSKEETYNNAYMQFTPYFNFGLPVLQAEGARVLFGLNTYVPVRIYDEIETGEAPAPTTKNNHNMIGVITNPNILGEIAINENWIVFAEATYQWDAFNRDATSSETGANTNDASTITMKTHGTTADAGVRFQYKQLTLEASIANNLDSQAWSGLIGNFGAFLIF